MDIFFQWLIDRWESLYCTFIVREYERVLQLRRGLVLRVAQPGWRWKLPFGIDELIRADTRTQTANLHTQVLETADGTNVVIGAVVRWRLVPEKVETAILTFDTIDSVQDIVYGMVAEQVAEHGVKDLPLLRAKILEAVRRRIGRYGFDIEDIYITDIAPAKTLRLVQGD